MQQKLEQKYVRLCQELKTGQIDAEVFVHEVDQLRCQDHNGNWWQISAETGKWLVWNGSEWAIPAAATDEKSQKRESGDIKPVEPVYTGKEPKSAAELPGFVSFDLRGLLVQILRNTFQRVRIMITFAIIAFLLHTFLIAVGNDGFDKNINISTMFSRLGSYNSTVFGGGLPWYIDYTLGDFKVGSHIAIKGNEWPAAFGWLLGGAVVFSMWRAFRSNGLINGLRRLFSMPKQVASACTPHLGFSLAALAVGIVFSRWLSDKLPHQSQNMLSFLSLGMVGSILPLALGSWLARFGMQLAGQTGQPALKKVSYAGLSQLIFLGISAGMFSRSSWQYGPTFGWALALYTLYLVITRTGHSLPVSGRVASFLSFTALAGFMLMLCEDTLFAHDKGWWENVNTNDPLTKQITSWIKANGSAELMKSGVPPSIGAAIGAGAADAAANTTTYVLQVSSYSLAVSTDAPAELLVAVWKSEKNGPLVPAGDAFITLAGQGEGWMTLSQITGGSRLTCLVGQRADTPANIIPQPSSIYITGSGGGQSCSATVTVSPGGGTAYVLEVF